LAWDQSVGRPVSQSGYSPRSRQGLVSDDIPVLKKDVDGFLFASSYCGRNLFRSCRAGNGRTYRPSKPLNNVAGLTRFRSAAHPLFLPRPGKIRYGRCCGCLRRRETLHPSDVGSVYSEMASIDHDWDAPHGMGLPGRSSR